MNFNRYRSPNFNTNPQEQVNGFIILLNWNIIMKKKTIKVRLNFE